MADRCERDGTHRTKDRVDVLRDGDVQRLEQLGEGEVHLLPRLLGLSSAKLGLEVAEVDEHLLCARLVSRTGWSLLDDDICDNVGLLPISTTRAFRLEQHLRRYLWCPSMM